MNMKNTAKLTARLILAIGLVMIFSQCQDNALTGVCTGCDSDHPWSVAGGSTCYETLSGCEAIHGSDCEYCI